MGQAPRDDRPRDDEPRDAGDDAVDEGPARVDGRIHPRTFRGMRDFLPAEMIRREEIFGYLREVFGRYGFSPLETPAVEYLEILLGKYGVEGEKLIYPLAYRGGHTLALRYDLTVPLARVIAQHSSLPRPFKRYQMQPVWRADRPQLIQGRYREFYQCDADIVGETSLIADAEILALTGEVLRGLEVGPFRVRVNHRRILEGLVRVAGLPLESVPAGRPAHANIDKAGEAGIEAELAAEGIEPAARRRILDLLGRPAGGKEAIEGLLAALPGDPGIEAGCADLLAIWDALEAMGAELPRYQFRLGLARGLDYYTGAVFESFLESLPHIGSLTGGGRYDGLVGVFSPEEVPAVGTTIGLDRIFSALEQSGQARGAASRTSVLVLQFGAEAETAALVMTGRLRAAGINTEVWYRPERLKKQLAQADRRGIPLVLFQGPDEAAAQAWTAKQLSTGEQRVLPDAEVPQRLRKWLEEAAPAG